MKDSYGTGGRRFPGLPHAASEIVPKPRPGRHGWLKAPISVGFWWIYQTGDAKPLPRPVEVTQKCIDDGFYERTGGLLWHPCLPPEPPVL